MVVKFKGVLKGYVRVLFKTPFIMDKNEMQDQVYLIKVGQSIITTCIANYENAYIYIYIYRLYNDFGIYFILPTFKAISSAGADSPKAHL
jgi:hypothetical protein